MKNTLFAFAAVAATLLFATMTGCETEKLSDTQLSISPSSATVAPGGSVTLTAQGGWDYVWSKPEHGTLSSYNGKKVTYTAFGNALEQKTGAVVDGVAQTSNVSSLTEIITVSNTSSNAASATATITIKGK